MIRALAFLAALVCLGACDRYDDALLIPPDPPAPDVTLPEIYVKGNRVVTVGLAHDFRTLPVDGAAGYSWTAVGAGAALVNSNGNARVATVTGAQPGTSIIRVVAYDAAERPIATGQKTVQVIE